VVEKKRLDLLAELQSAAVKEAPAAQSSSSSSSSTPSSLTDVSVDDAEAARRELKLYLSVIKSTENDEVCLFLVFSLIYFNLFSFSFTVDRFVFIIYHRFWLLVL
jgi:hypothetical protein